VFIRGKPRQPVAAIDSFLNGQLHSLDSKCHAALLCISPNLVAALDLFASGFSIQPIVARLSRRAVSVRHL
jgi:hypothetical protein